MTETQARVAFPAALALAVVVAATGSATAQTDAVNTVIGEQVKTEEAAQQSQKRVVQLDEETGRLLAEYRQATAESVSLKAYTAQLDSQVQAQQREMETMTRQLGEIETTAREVLPMMQKMLGTLEQFVQLDVPFLPDERTARILQLKDIMSRADVSISEKYRRIVEAYQIEMEYGRTIEAYQGKVNGKTVDVLRAGRVALMYQTLDGRESGYWDAGAKAWKQDDSYRDAVRSGLKVAKKQSAPDFLSAPLHAPVQVQQ
jgi:cell division protein FtsI/penicillin-binding protein 2